jgi:hypothetical protein
MGDFHLAVAGTGLTAYTNRKDVENQEFSQRTWRTMAGGFTMSDWGI